MKRILPPLTALLTFESAARLLSFKRAAAELTVSEAAVSRQIRNLEDYIGVPVFHRHHRRVELTEAGQRLFDPVNRGFGDMASVLSALKETPQERVVTVGTTGAFAFYWLMPRLAKFSEAWPDITVNHLIADEVVDLQSGAADVAIRYGAGVWRGLESTLLFKDRIYPVCSPDYLVTIPEPNNPQDLLAYPLFDARSIEGDDWVDWPAWFRLLGQPIGGMRGQYLNYLIGLQMALDHKGFVLGWHQFVADLVAEGRLVRPLDLEVQSPGGYYITSAEGRPLTAEAHVFTQWLQQEAAT